MLNDFLNASNTGNVEMGKKAQEIGAEIDKVLKEKAMKLREKETEAEILKAIYLKRFLNMEETALYMGICVNSLYKLTSGNKIPFYKPNGKNIYFDKEEIDNWIKQGRVATEVEIQQKAEEFTYNKRNGKGGAL